MEHTHKSTLAYPLQKPAQLLSLHHLPFHHLFTQLQHNSHTTNSSFSKPPQLISTSIYPQYPSTLSSPSHLQTTNIKHPLSQFFTNFSSLSTYPIHIPRPIPRPKSPIRPLAKLLLPFHLCYPYSTSHPAPQVTNQASRQTSPPFPLMLSIFHVPSRVPSHQSGLSPNFSSLSTYAIHIPRPIPRPKSPIRPLAKLLLPFHLCYRYSTSHPAPQVTNQASRQTSPPFPLMLSIFHVPSCAPSHQSGLSPNFSSLSTYAIHIPRPIPRPKSPIRPLAKLLLPFHLCYPYSTSHPAPQVTNQASRQTSPPFPLMLSIFHVPSRAPSHQSGLSPNFSSLSTYAIHIPRPIPRPKSPIRPLAKLLLPFHLCYPYSTSHPAPQVTNQASRQTSPPFPLILSIFHVPSRAPSHQSGLSPNFSSLSTYAIHIPRPIPRPKSPIRPLAKLQTMVAHCRMWSCTSFFT